MQFTFSGKIAKLFISDRADSQNSNMQFTFLRKITKILLFYWANSNHSSLFEFDMYRSCIFFISAARSHLQKLKYIGS